MQSGATGVVRQRRSFALARRIALIWLYSVGVGTLIVLCIQPAIAPDDHRQAVAAFVPNRVIDGTEQLSPAANGCVCWMEREAMLRRKYGIQPTNEYARWLVYWLSRANCLFR